jgi:hypothetical protein
VSVSVGAGLEGTSLCQDCDGSHPDSGGQASDQDNSRQAGIGNHDANRSKCTPPQAGASPITGHTMITDTNPDRSTRPASTDSQPHNTRSPTRAGSSTRHGISARRRASGCHLTRGSMVVAPRHLPPGWRHARSRMTLRLTPRPRRGKVCGPTPGQTPRVVGRRGRRVCRDSKRS